MLIYKKYNRRFSRENELLLKIFNPLDMIQTILFWNPVCVPLLASEDKNETFPSQTIS